MERQSRRHFLRQAAIGALGFWSGGQLLWLTPAEARMQAVPLRVLQPAEATTLEAFAEFLLPGSAAAGIAHFLDQQLSAPLRDQMLVIRYLGVEPPFQPFYAGGLAALDAAAQAATGRDFAALDTAQRDALARLVMAGDLAGWAGPPAPFFTFVVRSDVLDVMYGTMAGFDRLDIPYLAHIQPPSRWGEP